MKSQIDSDKIGICVSLLCITHCLSIPILFVLGLDSLWRSLDQEWVEWTIIGFALTIGLISFLGGFFTHRQHFIPVLFVAGFLLLVNGESVDHAIVSLSLSIAGALVIAYAHIQNQKWKRYAIAR